MCVCEEGGGDPSRSLCGLCGDAFLCLGSVCMCVGYAVFVYFLGK